VNFHVLSVPIDGAEPRDLTTARDGLPLSGYLTLPAGFVLGQDFAEPLPLVVNPHGGPWARNWWGFNAETQLLANRGYAVLQVNFRGSTGYGRALWEASHGQWGRAMQNDLDDGVDWLVSQGIVDPARVGIYGASYGGYATLAGVAFEAMDAFLAEHLGGVLRK
jgi:dipeptidyl aminopeptidase/acylaminoacyl peptidase